MNYLLIEDENTAVRRLSKMIATVRPDWQLLTDLDSIEAVVLWLKKNPLPDLIFCDIHLADGLSFEIFKQITIDCPIIFTTAYDQYAIQAFKVNAIDYLLKPIKIGELEQSIEKFEKTITSAQPINYQEIINAVQQKEEVVYQKRFLIRFGQKYKVIGIKEIAYFFIQNKIVFAATHHGKNYPMDDNLDKLEAIVNPKDFFRINRQVLANINAIKEMYAYSKSRIKIDLSPTLDYEVIISYDKSAKFKKWLIGQE